MTVVLTKRAKDVFASTDEGGSKRPINADEARQWGMIIEGLLNLNEITPVTENHSLAAEDVGSLLKVDASTGAVSIPLLAVATAGEYFWMIVRKSDASDNVVTISGDGAETIDGKNAITLTEKNSTVFLRCDGTSWHVLYSHNYYPQPVTLRQAESGDLLTLQPKAGATGALIKINSDYDAENGVAAHSFDVMRALVIGDAPGFIEYMGSRADGDMNWIHGHYYGRQMGGQFNRIAQWGDHAQGLSTYSMIACNGAAEIGGQFLVGHSWNSDYEQVTALPDGVRLGRFGFFGTDGVDRNGLGGWIEGRTDGAWSASSHPSRVRVSVCPENDTVPQTVLSLDKNGQSTFEPSNPVDGTLIRHSYQHNGGQSAGTEILHALSPTDSDPTTRYSGFSSYNYGGNDIGFDVRVSYGGNVIKPIRVHGRGMIDFKIDPTVETPAAGYLGFYITSDGFQRQRDSAGVEHTAMQAGKVTTYNDDADHTLTLQGMKTFVFSIGALTNHRTYTLPDGDEPGQELYLNHKGSGAFNIQVTGTGLSRDVGLGETAFCVWTGSAWSLVLKGSN